IRSTTDEWPCRLCATVTRTMPTGRTSSNATAFVRYLASEAHLQDVHYLWRPFLPDSDDDMVLELAFAAGCEYIITHNERDFHGIDRFGIIAISPQAFLRLLRNQT